MRQAWTLSGLFTLRGEVVVHAGTAEEGLEHAKAGRWFRFELEALHAPSLWGFTPLGPPEPKE